jgi:hypothetical protein
MALAAGMASGAARPASRIVDRTVLCRTSGEGYPDPARYLAVQASPRLGSQSPSASVYNGPSGAGVVRADITTGPYYGSETGSVTLSRFRCGRASLAILLSSKRLRGRKTTLGDRYTCEVPDTIFIRVRAVFRNPVTLSPAADARHLNLAKGRILTGSLAVTTKSKSPIAFVSVDDATGQASIFVAPSRCVPTD